MHLAHLHLPGITPFRHVSHLQNALTTRFLASKRRRREESSIPPPPDPTILTFTPNPVYTTGRREWLPPTTTGPGSDALPPSLEPIRPLLTGSSASDDPTQKIAPTAEYHATLRGGQTTYHGPGQLVAYTILDLRRLGLTPRCHVRLLENSVIDVLRGFGVRGFVTDDPGVWIRSTTPPLPPRFHPRDDGRADQDPLPRKVAAVGVHLRRHISSYGVGFNITPEPLWFFRQITACGLQGREATCLFDHLPRTPGVAAIAAWEDTVAEEKISIGTVAVRFVEALVRRLKIDPSLEGAQRKARCDRIDSVYRIREEDVLS